MAPWLLLETPEIPWVDDRQQLTDDAIRRIDEAFWFAWSDERNLVALCDDTDTHQPHGR